MYNISMDIKERIKNLEQALKIKEKLTQLAELKLKLSGVDIWKDERTAGKINSQVNLLEGQVKEWQDLDELSQVASDQELESLLPRVKELEKCTYFSGKYDGNDTIVQIFSGAGGVDAQDWAEMLLKMYVRYAQNQKSKLKNQKWEAEIIDIAPGGEAGIKNATVLIRGEYVFGQLKGESGVHRLVRLSPFNAKNLRQTSFALVEVIPEIENPGEVKINADDLKIDVFRSSGHGGQSVNTTDSAVRITHLPTGIVVTCQNQRSQLQNKETALRILKSRLQDLAEKEHKANISELKGQAKSIEWGSQIRSYVLHPYKMVKDHRTGYETSDVESVLDGKLNGSIESYLKGQ